jgi:hypothetical protein
MKSSARYRLALVVIARDEAPRIERLLSSVRAHVDEMLVLDTGSVDGTPALARAAGARVEHFPWCDDFSAARNRALDWAAADWHLVLDADEWLEEGAQTLAQLRSTAPDFVGVLQLKDHFDGGAASQWLSRVLPGSVRYAGRVHEQPVHQLPLRRLALRVGHDGYLPASLAAKRGRNRTLLEAMVKDAPSDAYAWYQLGKDHAVYDEHAEAETAFAHAAQLLERPVPWWADLVARRLYGLKLLKLHAVGVDFAEAQLERCGESPDFFFALGDLLLDLAAEDPAHAAGPLAMAEQAWRRCLALGERPEQPGAVAGRGSHLAAHNLALVLEGTGRAGEAQELRKAYGL